MPRKDRYSTIPRTTCLIFDESNRLLLIEFSEQKGELAGYFDPPGGHIEYGESIIQSAEREIHEETGLAVVDTWLAGIVHVSNFFETNIMLFVTHSLAATTDVIPSEEGIPHWVEIDTLKNIRVFDDIAIMTQRLNDFPNKTFTAHSEFDNGKLVHFTFD